MASIYRPKLLFLDDEAPLVQGLRRVLRPQQGWDMRFETSPHNALDLLATSKFDVIISDMRMPEIDGSQFLRSAMVRSPSSARIVLSGQADQEAILRCLPVTHQHFSKPYSIEDLIHRLEVLLQFRRVIPHPELRAQLCSIQRLPVDGRILTQLRQEIRSPNPSAMVLAELISSDLCLSLKILQLANSSFFGTAEETYSILQSVRRLGNEALRKVLLEVDLFEELRESDELNALRSLINRDFGDLLMSLAMEETLTRDEQIRALAKRCRWLGAIILYQRWPSFSEHLEHWISISPQQSLFAQLDVLGFPISNIGLFMLAQAGLPAPLLWEINSVCRGSVALIESPEESHLR